MSGIINPDDFFRKFGGRKPNYHELLLPMEIERRLVSDDQNKRCDLCRDIRMFVFEKQGRGYVFYEEMMRHPNLVKHLNQIWPDFPPKHLYR